jgi:Cdc6-like AAA superfamily ATPase
MDSAKWHIMLISGSPGTGKTATVQKCIEMCNRPSQVSFVNCKTERPNFHKFPKKVRLLVLDEIESLPVLAELIRQCQALKCSIIGISNYHDETLAIARSGRSDAISLVFKTYTPRQLIDIMRERIGGQNPSIAKESLMYIAKTIGKDRGDAREVLGALNMVLTSAVNSGLERLDLQKTQSILASRSDRKGKMEDFPLIEQIALISVFKGRKQWKNVFRTYLTQKKVAADLDFGSIFERLTSYGFVSGSAANPKCTLEEDQLKDGLDPIAGSLLE